MEDINDTIADAYFDNENGFRGLLTTYKNAKKG